ncbi:MAG: hypothetical protein GW946_01775 [Candidatus Pacebacteria bacterium]|nr:hypothetical protein [Candidatus Paceibacterota bacterium]PIR60479.1 MAG: hypothetical protein COU67_01750 [Candidatus Pacebacteria bacterium CG10_big_fil_rev_8_21_14_0_10_44_54]
MLNSTSKTASQSNSINPTVAATITGAAIGAGVVAAGVVAMKNSTNQEKVKQVIDDVKAKASSYMRTAEEQVSNGKSKVEETKGVAHKSNQKVKKIWQK